MNKCYAIILNWIQNMKKKTLIIVNRVGNNVSLLLRQTSKKYLLDYE